jgi:hypothetical protein
VEIDITNHQSQIANLPLAASSQQLTAIQKPWFYKKGRIHEPERNQDHLARTRNLSRRYAWREEHHSRSLGQRQSEDAG